MTSTSLPSPVVARPATSDDGPALTQLWNLFRHDMSPYSGALPDSDGRYRSERLDHALAAQPGWQAWLATAGPHPVGLAVARALDEPEHVLSSFFVVAAARRGGLGRQLARAVLTTRPGRWAVAYQDANTRAARFWADVAAGLDPSWVHEHRDVPNRPDLPPDSWIRLDVEHP
ncbi:GNAT family N-acetyltransferase [Luteimicrobium album]|uniref:GNAT family N-acetyltransferase n=1 Tax=Luteimicrobium album TaxID=1054550 RepID=UPI0024E18416|nr:GNAT family N-acetyltransferase [Luteimicrobium album]